MHLNMAGKSLKTPMTGRSWDLYPRQALKTATLFCFLRNFAFLFFKMALSHFPLPPKSPTASLPQPHLGTLLPAPHSGLYRASWSFHRQLCSFCTLTLRCPFTWPPFVGWLPSSPAKGHRGHNPSNRPIATASPFSPSPLDYAFKLLI